MTTSVLALDIGAARTGVAIARSVARIASPLCAVTDQESLPQTVATLIAEHNVAALVVGLPRNLSGDKTPQTHYVEEVAKKIEEVISIPLHFVDEAVTSAQAEAELKARRKPYAKEDIDMLSATYILEDFLRSNPEVFHVS